jgi:hypothetical protein
MVNFMMQDTVLNLCKDSVQEFKDFILSFVPEKTIIHSTAHIDNIFPETGAEDNYEPDETLLILEDDLPEARMIKEEILREEEAKRFPKPLFVLDLVPGKNGSLIPKYSTPPTDIVQRVKGVFEEGVKVLTEIPQLE